MSGTGTEGGTPDTFISHLVELRDRLLNCIYALLIVALPCVYFAPQLYDILAAPMQAALPAGTKMIATGVIAPFFIPVKVALLVAFVIALPYLLYQIWAFVAPGLYQHEKKVVVPLIVSSTLLFLVGILFCYFIVFKFVFATIAQFAPQSISVAPDIENYFNFVLGMFFAFGVAFETPVVVVVLVGSGIVKLQTLIDVRRYAIVGAFAISAVVTPPDAASMLALAIPLCILYEIGLLCARFFVKPEPAAPAVSSEQ
ncbi:MAG: twin-arginine translocase subunit TatC [Betaproteobacteria bacterium]|nr:twin-arginine translocase subunit TatC [Betaproteobacteria bacterium]